MAPEVVNRKGHGTTADWWSFGVLMVSQKGIAICLCKKKELPSFVTVLHVY